MKKSGQIWPVLFTEVWKQVWRLLVFFNFEFIFLQIFLLTDEYDFFGNFLKLLEKNNFFHRSWNRLLTCLVKYEVICFQTLLSRKHKTKISIELKISQLWKWDSIDFILFCADMKIYNCFLSKWKLFMDMTYKSTSFTK